MQANEASGGEVLGRGIAFPLRLSGGVVGMNAYDSQVAQSIGLVLRTGLGERVMRPDFGVGADRLAFEPIGAVTAALLQHQVKEALARQEPRVELLSVTVTVEPAPGVLRAAIAYRVRQSDAVANMVYPFYVERGEG
jgi:hypothetical protein